MLPKLPTRIQILRFITLTMLFVSSLFLLPGCSDDEYPRSLDGGGANYTQHEEINSDQTYQDKITCSSGTVFSKSGTWQTIQQAGMGNMPDVDPNEQYLVLKNDYDDVQNACTDHKTVRYQDTIEPESMFSLSQSQVQSDENAGKTWYAIIVLASLAIWGWALIDICLRRFDDVNTKIAWVVAIIVCGGIGSIAYLLMGRGSSEMPKSKSY